MTDYSLESLHVLLEQEIGAYATYDYLRTTSDFSPEQEEHCDSDNSDDHPEHTCSPLPTLGVTLSGARKRKRLLRNVDDVDIAFAKARVDRESWRQRVCTWCYAGKRTIAPKCVGFLHRCFLKTTPS
jgi:hypothetical protein